jgi:hypothetical protein
MHAARLTDTETMSDAIANRMRISAIAREDREQLVLQDGDGNMMWQSAWSMMSSINSRFAAADSVSAPDPALLDIDMHDLWHTYWHGAVNTAPDSPKLDRLALQIIQSREQGTLAVTTNSGNLGIAAAVAVTSEGYRIWTDLPFLVQDMTAHWIHNCAVMSSAERLSGAQFLALLAAAGTAADDALCGIALVVLREALETPRGLGHLTARGPDPNRQLQDLSIADLLPPTNAWIFTAGRKLVQLSDVKWKRCPADVGKLGELVLAQSATTDPTFADVALPTHEGFSPQRWTWWLRRLEQLATLASQDPLAGEVHDGQRSLVSLIRGMMDNMVLIAEQTSGTVAKAQQQSDRDVRHKPIMQQLGPGRPGAPGTSQKAGNPPEGAV